MSKNSLFLGFKKTFTQHTRLQPGSDTGAASLNRLIGSLVNAVRAVIILLVAAIPLRSSIVGTSIGVAAAIVPYRSPRFPIMRASSLGYA